MLKNIIGFLALGTTPGEAWRISGYEAHCMFIALERLSPYFNDEDIDFLIWHQTLLTEAQKYALRQHVEVTSHTEIIPCEKDRVIWEILLKAERARLAEYEPNAPCYDCGGTVYDHENAIREWLEREIELPKSFIISRRKFEDLSLIEKLNRVKILAREDAKKIIEQEIERLKVQIAARDVKILEEVETTPEVAPFEKTIAAGMLQAHETTLEDARKQLWAVLEKFIID